VSGRRDLVFEVRAVGGEQPVTATAKSTFFGPVPQ